MVKTLMISWHENLIFTWFGLQTVQSSNQLSRSQIHEALVRVFTFSWGLRWQFRRPWNFRCIPYDSTCFPP